MIHTKAHATLDYLTGILLILSPWLFGFAGKDEAADVPVLLGFITIFYSLWTDYEYSIISAIPMRIHLILDFISAVFLMASPWVFHFSTVIYWPHVAIGIMELVVILMSKHKRTNRRRHAVNTRS